MSQNELTEEEVLFVCKELYNDDLQKMSDCLGRALEKATKANNLKLIALVNRDLPAVKKCLEKINAENQQEKKA